MSLHIRHTHSQLIGTAWCGAEIGMGACFLNPEHAAYALVGQSAWGDGVCPRCLLTLMDVFMQEYRAARPIMPPLDGGELEAVQVRLGRAPAPSKCHEPGCDLERHVPEDAHQSFENGCRKWFTERRA